MIGNQAILNSQVFNHPDNPIKEDIGDNDPMDIIYMITEEYWKEWRRKMTTAHEPHIYAPGLGSFNLMHGKSKQYLRKMLSKIRSVRRNYPDTYLVEGTMANGLHNFYLARFRNTWKQVNELKIEINKRMEIWREKKIKKYGDKAIL